jgi:O-antigen/teichoic acid export membrane protein
MHLRFPTAFGGVSRVVTGSIAGQGLVMLSYPFLTRLYDVAEFGLLTVFTSVITIISISSSAALNRAIPIPPADQEAADVAWTAMAAVMITTVLTAAVGLVAGPAVAELLGVPQLARYWWLVALTVFVLGAYNVLSVWMVRERSYGALGRRNVLLGVGQVATQVGLGLTQVRPLGLLLGLGVGRLFGFGGLLSGGGLLRQPLPSLAALRRTLRRYRRFPLLTVPSGLLNSGGLEVPLLVVSAFYGDARAGLLGLTVRVVAAPTMIIGQAISQVVTGESSAAIREPRGTLASMLRYTVGRLLMVGALPAALLLIAAPWLFGVVFGPTWTEAGDYARILALAYLLQFAVNPIAGTLQLLERQGQSLAWAGARLLLTVSGPMVCGLIGAPVLVAIASLSIGHILGYAIMYGLCLRAAQASDDQHRRAREEPC